MKALGTPLAFGLVILVWLLFAPAELGGQTRFVTITGASMEPRFHTGDLAIVRSSDGYAVGDVVAYQHPEVGLVLHRIVAIDGPQYVLQGDNNSWLDSYSPAIHEIDGKLWIHVPEAGGYLESARQPTHLAIATVLIGAVMLLPRRKTEPAQKEPNSFRLPSLFDVAGRELFGFAVVIGLGGALLAFVAFGSDIERVSVTEQPYQHDGAFSYSAAAPEGVYDRPGVATGDPIFRNLTDAFDVQFDYALTSNAPANAAGSAGLTAEIQSQNGWQRTFEIAPLTAFDGGAASLSGTVDLTEVQNAIDRMEAESGVEARSYDLVIQADVTTEGDVAGQTVTDTFAPLIRFQLDDQQLQFDRSSTQDGDALNPQAGGAVATTTMVPDTIGIGPFDPSVSTARTVSLAIVGGALLVTGVLLTQTALTRRRGGWSRLPAGFSERIVALDGRANWLAGTFVEINSLEDFTRLAQLIDGPIYHVTDGHGEHFVLQSDGERLRYTATPPAGPVQDRHPAVSGAEQNDAGNEKQA